MKKNGSEKTSFKAFTLAEVLVTMMVIGVVAAMAIPNLVKNYQKTQYVTLLKKTYTGFNQALARASADKGCINDLACSGLFADGSNSTKLGQELVPYFHTYKVCGDESGKGCFPEKTWENYDRSDYSPEPSGYYSNDDTSLYKFVTTDGVSIAIESYAKFGGGWANCGSSSSTGKTGHMTQNCGRVIIDVNGTKMPNVFGRDVYEFYITNGKGPLLYPRGGIDDAAGSGGDSSWWKDPASEEPRSCYPGKVEGLKCGARIMEEGWQMNY